MSTIFGSLLRKPFVTLSFRDKVNKFVFAGIDDMFVIMQCFDNLKPSEKRPGDNAYNIGMTMKHAGVAISVTSITDVVVFGVGASTVRSYGKG